MPGQEVMTLSMCTRRLTTVRKFVCSLLFMWLVATPAAAQYNIDRLLMMGRSALYYEDYVLSIQYFNQAINAKPYLFEPWYFRGVAKYYLDDYVGAERDCSEAINLNPYVVGIYELRGLCHIQLKQYEEAIKDYNAALRYDPEGQNLWHNRALCRIQMEDYQTAQLEIDSMLQHWSRNARIYTMQSEVYLLQKDTTQAISSLEKSLELDAYDGRTWAMRAAISLAKEEWKEAEEYLDKSIHLLPKQGGSYINRALARYNQNNLRGAMSDYDLALDYEPNNFLAHYNRGLLRAQVGDDNRAIVDFDFVLKLEPDNFMALYNRALLLEKTGNPRAAIRDYSKVIEEFPNFWVGLQQRAQCYRSLGMTKQAEQDEFRILKAQINKRYGIQPRLSKKQMRKRSDEDIEKYNQLAVADEQEMEHEYQSDYRGKVQNHRVSMDYMPMYSLSTESYQNAVKHYVAYDRHIDQLNNELPRDRRLHIVCTKQTLSEAATKRYFSRIDSLTQQIANTRQEKDLLPLLLQRAIAYSIIQNNDGAIDDLDTYLQIDSTSVAAYWLRGVCQSKLSEFYASQGTDIRMRTAREMADFCQALKIGENAYLYYNRGNVYVEQHNLTHAIEDYTRAIRLDPNLAEAYYNRGLAHLALKQDAEATSDLSKAGELGLYAAYSILKRQRK